MTPQERKIKRLEGEVKIYKTKIEVLENQIQNLQHYIGNERAWRMDFQTLMKAVVQENDLKDYQY